MRVRSTKSAKSAATEARESEASFIALTAAAAKFGAALSERRGGAGYVLTFAGRITHFPDLPDVRAFLDMARPASRPRARLRMRV